jgi:hypothetical protein
MNRKSFLQQTALLAAGVLCGEHLFAAKGNEFSKRLQPVGRALELEGYYVWCNSPIYGPDGKVHVFFSRWNAAKKMGGWINGSEIAHAVADSPESPFTVLGTILAPRGPGYWDATTCHNPLITQVGSQYYLFFMGNSNGKTNTKRIGLAVADSLYGPWKRPDAPLLEAGAEGAWDDHCTTNPAFIQHSDGKYWLYYKSWNTKEYDTATGPIRGNRKYGVAMADNPEGPYTKYEHNPVIDFSALPDNAQLEDAFIWKEHKRYQIIARDMGIYNHENGLLMSAKDGLHWNKPEIAYYAADHYIQQPPAPAHLKKYGRFERPQLLLKDGKPTHLFTTSQGGKFMTSSPFIFRLK